jgi:hypothetical protein
MVGRIASGIRAERFDAREWLKQRMELMAAELALWHEYYPHRRRFIEEEARAKVEKREPNYPPPVG